MAFAKLLENIRRSMARYDLREGEMEGNRVHTTVHELKSDHLTFKVSNVTDEETYFNAVLLPGVKQVELAVLDQQAERYNEYVEMFRQQFDGFSLTCERVGDFLSLVITKLGNALDIYGPGHQEKRTKYVTAINLADVKTLQFRHGKAAGFDGRVSYSIDEMPDFENLSGVKRRTLKKPPPKGFICRITTRHPTAYPFQKVFFADYDTYRKYEQSKDDDGYPSNRYIGIRPTTEGIASPSLDDIIIFEGLNLVLLIPFGKGEEVYSQILAAIASGYEPSTISIITEVDTGVERS